jgi:uridine monophosphate synthetase
MANDAATLCVGLDPISDLSDDEKACDEMLARNDAIIKASSEFASCFKPNIAFYEARGAYGLALLQKTLELIPPSIPVIIDAKRCDIDSTGEAYAKAIFGRTEAGAVTISSYMGIDAALPFLRYDDRCVFMLCRTSNPGAKEFQDRAVGSGGKVYEFAARLYAGDLRSDQAKGYSDRIGLVVAGNDVDALADVRRLVPNAWFLAPGIGAQGGTMADAMRAGARQDGYGVIPVVARAIAKAEDPHAEARRLNQEALAAISAAKEASRDRMGEAKDRVFRSLIETGCFKLGEFILKSGKKSPFYVDLRRVVSDPKALEIVADAYASVVADVRFDRIAGIPVAALPLATALSLKVGKPMIYPRLDAKGHGTGNKIEGEYRTGERVLLLDDLITTGLSKIEAIEVLRNAGLEVVDLAVLLERGSIGRKDMEKAGVSLRAYAHVREFFSTCEHLGMIDREERNRLEAFVDSE